MALRIYRVTVSRWAQLAATRHVDLTDQAVVDLTQNAEASAFDRGRRRRAELTLIQAYVDALQPQPTSASR